MFPEWAVSCILGLINVRQIFNTGLRGDKSWRDETPEEKEKRERKEERKREKKSLKAGTRNQGWDRFKLSV
jgi:hypothetical protein